MDYIIQRKIRLSESSKIIFELYNYKKSKKQNMVIQEEICGGAKRNCLNQVTHVGKERLHLKWPKSTLKAFNTRKTKEECFFSHLPYFGLHFSN